MRKGEVTRQTILDEAIRIASVSGFDGLSIGSLADAVGMSKSGLFAHFRSKEALQLATLQRGTELFIQLVIAPALKMPRGEPRVRALFEAGLRWEREVLPGGCILQTAVYEFDDQPGPIRDYLAETQREFFETIARIARQSTESGAFRKDLDARTFAFELANLFAGYRRHLRLLRDKDAEKLTREAFESLLARARA